MTTILLFGRTNVGKSSLFNALIGRRVSVTDAKEDLTKDVIKHSGHGFTLFDSPGVRNKTDLEQILLKTGPIDIFCLVVEYLNANHFDKDLLSFLKNRECILIVNKFESGFDTFSCPIANIEYIPVSVLNRFNIDKLRKRLGIIHLKRKSNHGISKKDIGSSWSIFGRANVGKSTLANILVGSERFVVKNEIGTTLEVHSDVSIRIMADIHDTPGYRRNTSLDSLAKASQHRLVDHITREDSLEFGIIVIDTSSGFTTLDRHIIDKILDSFFIILVITKIDLVNNFAIQTIENEIHRVYPTLPVIKISSTKKTGISALISQMKRAYRSVQVEIKTSALNKCLNEKVKIPAVKYITRTDILDFVLFSKRDLSISEQRYIEKIIITEFGLFGSRLRLDIRVKDR